MIIWRCQSLISAPWGMIRRGRQRTLCTEVAIVFGQSVPKIFEIYEQVLCFTESFRWPELLRECGAYASSSEARRAGWNKDIESGLTEVSLKRKLGFRAHMYEFTIWRDDGE